MIIGFRLGLASQNETRRCSKVGFGRSSNSKFVLYRSMIVVFRFQNGGHQRAKKFGDVVQLMTKCKDSQTLLS